MRRRARLGGLFALLLAALLVPLLASPAQAAPAGADSTQGATATCSGASYVMLLYPATGEGLDSRFSGRTLNVNLFSLMQHHGVVRPGTSVVFEYRWNANDGFDYTTTNAESNCVIRQEPNPIFGSFFPVGIQVRVRICYYPWEFPNPQQLCQPLGFINRVS